MTSQDGRNEEDGREKHIEEGLRKKQELDTRPNTSTKDKAAQGWIVSPHSPRSTVAKHSIFWPCATPRYTENALGAHYCTRSEPSRVPTQERDACWYASTRMQGEHGKANFKAKLTLGVSVHRLRRFGPAVRPLPFGRRGLAIAVAHALSRTPRYFSSLDTM